MVGGAGALAVVARAMGQGGLNGSDLHPWQVLQ